MTELPYGMPYDTGATQPGYVSGSASERGDPGYFTDDLPARNLPGPIASAVEAMMAAPVEDVEGLEQTIDVDTMTDEELDLLEKETSEYDGVSFDT